MRDYDGKEVLRLKYIGTKNPKQTTGELRSGVYKIDSNWGDWFVIDFPHHIEYHACNVYVASLDYRGHETFLTGYWNQKWKLYKENEHCSNKYFDDFRAKVILGG